MKLLLRWVLSAGALILLSYYLPGIKVESFYTALIAALVLGLVNAVIRPIIVVLTLPVNVLTLGLFGLVINALMLLLTTTVVKGFYIENFAAAFWGSLAMSVLGWLIHMLIKE